jgi:hypothetical protein
MKRVSIGIFFALLTGGCVPSTTSTLEVTDTKSGNCKSAIEQSIVRTGFHITAREDSSQEIKKLLSKETIFLFEGAPKLGVFGSVEGPFSGVVYEVNFSERAPKFSEQALRVQGEIADQLKIDCEHIKTRHDQEPSSNAKANN